ncbi:hypothetical protein Tco_1506220 [Tanacetum coccineum]
MILATTPLLGFSGEISWSLGQISLMVSLGDEEYSTSALMNFMVVRSLSPYNGIIGRPGLQKIQAVPSTAHGMLKFPVEGGIVTIRNNTIIPEECRMVAEAQNVLPPREPTATEAIKVAIHPEYPEQIVMIGVPRSIAEHCLNIRKGCQPIRQKRRGRHQTGTKRYKEEVAKLVEAEIMREVHYHDWLSNPVMCFLDAYKGYHQIQMAEKDEEKTAFHTNQGVFWYTKMSFGLKNVRATYQRLVDKAFEKLIGWNLEVYVDDLVNISGPSGKLDGTPTLSDGRDTTKTVETYLVFEVWHGLELDSISGQQLATSGFLQVDSSKNLIDRGSHLLSNSRVFQKYSSIHAGTSLIHKGIAPSFLSSFTSLFLKGSHMAPTKSLFDLALEDIHLHCELLSLSLDVLAIHEVNSVGLLRSILVIIVCDEQA